MDAPPPAQPADAPHPQAAQEEPDYADLDEDQDMTCPISYQLMHDPVRVLASGRIMDRSSIEMNFMRQLFHSQPLSCPMTCIRVASMNDLQPLPKLQAYIRQHCINFAQPPPKPCPGPVALLCDCLTFDNAQVRAKAEVQLMQHIQLGLSYEEARELWVSVTKPQPNANSFARMFVLGTALAPTYLLLAAKRQQPGNPAVFKANVLQVVSHGLFSGITDLLRCDSTELQAVAAEALALLAPVHGAMLAAAGVPAALVQLLRTSDDESVQRAAAKAVSQMMWKEQGVIKQEMEVEVQKHLCTVDSEDPSDQTVGLQLVVRLLQHAAAVVPLATMAPRLISTAWLTQVLQTSDHPDVLKQALAVMLLLLSDPQLQSALVQSGTLTALVRVAGMSEGLHAPAVQALEACCRPSSTQEMKRAIMDQLPGSVLLQLQPAVLAQLMTTVGLPQLRKLLADDQPQLQTAAAEALTTLCSTLEADSGASEALLQSLSDTEHQQAQRAVAAAVSKRLWASKDAAGDRLRGLLRQHLLLSRSSASCVLATCLLQQASEAVPVEKVAEELGILSWVSDVIEGGEDESVVQQVLLMASSLVSHAALHAALAQAGFLQALKSRVARSSSLRPSVEQVLAALCAAIKNPTLWQSVIEQTPADMLASLLPALPGQIIQGGCIKQLLQLLECQNVELQTAAATVCLDIRPQAIQRWAVIPTLLQHLGSTQKDPVRRALVTTLCKCGWAQEGEVRQEARSHLASTIVSLESKDSDKQLAAVRVTAALSAHCKGVVAVRALVMDLGVPKHLASLLRTSQHMTVVFEALKLVTQLARHKAVQAQLVAQGILPLLSSKAATNIAVYHAAKQSLDTIAMHQLAAGTAEVKVAVLDALHILVTPSQSMEPATLVLSVDLVGALVALLQSATEERVLQAAMRLLAALLHGYHVEAALLEAKVVPALSRALTACPSMQQQVAKFAGTLKDRSAVPQNRKQGSNALPGHILKQMQQLEGLVEQLSPPKKAGTPTTPRRQGRTRTPERGWRAQRQ